MDTSQSASTRPALAVVCLLASLFLAGCSTMSSRVELEYTPRGAREKVQGAEQVKVEVKMTDLREIRDRVGTKMNSFGGDGAAIEAKNDVLELIKGAVEKELSQRGFGRGADTVVAVSLVKFYNQFTNGFWAGDATADFSINVQVKNQAGAVVFSRQFKTSGVEANIQVGGANNAKLALQTALVRGIADLFDDPEFIPALLKAGGANH